MATRIRLRIGIATFAVASLGLLLFVNCGTSDEKRSTSGDPSPAASTASTDGTGASVDAADATSSTSKPKGPRGPIDPSKVGTITGVVRFDGEPPERKALSMSSGGCPEHTKPVFAEDAVVEHGALANVFVHIKDGLSGWTLPPLSEESFEVDQKGCLYVPHVLGMRTGGKLLVRNSDPTTHNVNVRAQVNNGLNPIQPPGGKPVEWIPGKKELGVRFECNLHPWMNAFVCVVDDPWFAVTGADGSFSLAGVPPGDYVLEAWHEKYGKRTAKVSLEPGGKPTANFTFKP